MQKLQGSSLIPFVAVLPGGDPAKVIRLGGVKGNGTYSQGQVISALESAGPSRSVSALSKQQRPDTTAAKPAGRQPTPDRPAIIMSRLP